MNNQDIALQMVLKLMEGKSFPSTDDFYSNNNNTIEAKLERQATAMAALYNTILKDLTV